MTGLGKRQKINKKEGVQDYTENMDVGSRKDKELSDEIDLVVSRLFQNGCLLSLHVCQFAFSLWLIHSTKPNLIKVTKVSSLLPCQFLSSFLQI